MEWELRDQFRKTGLHKQYLSIMVLTPLSYLAFKKFNISLYGSFILPAMASVIPTAFFGRIFFIDRTEEKKLREIMKKSYLE